MNCELQILNDKSCSGTEANGFENPVARCALGKAAAAADALMLAAFLVANNTNDQQ